MKSKILPIVASLCLLLNSFVSPLSAFAEELTELPQDQPGFPSELPTETPSPSPTPTPTLDTFPALSPGIESTPYPSQQILITPTPNSSPLPMQTPVTLGTLYMAQENEKASVAFTKLPENPGTLMIKEIKLTSEQILETGALSDTAYEITSSMENGTFEYTLTLPTLQGQSAGVKYSEDGQNFADVAGEKVEQDTVTITGLTHFTVFVVAGTISSGNSTPFDESNSTVVINEFMFNPSSGNDWVELYNRGSESINLSNWTLEDNTSNIATLNGTLYPNGFLAFDVSNRLNTASSGDSIVLKNSSEAIVDRVSYKDSTTINGADSVGSVGTGQSIGRTADGIISGDIWTRYSSPTKGYNNSDDITFLNVGEIYPFTTIREGINQVSEGGTVNVLAGNYDEADIMVETENVTIQGPGIGSGITRAVIEGSCGESSPPAMFHLHADGITLKGFEIDGSDCEEHGVHIGGASEEFRVAGVTVTQNVVYSAENGVTISLASSYDSERPNVVSENDISQNDQAGVYLLSASNNIISDNNIYDNGNYGILLEDGGSGPSDNNQILNNTITEHFNDAGIYSGGSAISDLTIDGNEITDNYYGIYLNEITGSLIITDNEVINHSSFGVYFNTISDAQVTIGGGDGEGNTITENGFDDEGSGIYFESIEDGSTVNILGNTINENGENDEDPGIYVERLLSNNSLTIQSNTISQNFDMGIYLEQADGITSIANNTINNNSSTGIFLTGSVTGVTILSNTIQNNGTEDDATGIVVESAIGNQAHLNSITGNGVGVENQDNENIFNAIENWWGSISGPQGEGADSVDGNVLFEPWCRDADCDHVFFQPPEGSLLEDVSYGLPPGATLEDTPSLSFFSEEIFTITHTGGSSTVTIPSGVVITRSDNEDFDAGGLTTDDVNVNSLAGLGTGVIAGGAVQWGLPNTELTFTSAITLSIFVGEDLNGQTLNVVRSTTGTDGWTSIGIVAPGTCLVANGLCSFQATRASYYAATSTTTSSSSSASTTTTDSVSSPLSVAGAPSCGDQKPGSAPTLLRTVAGTNSVTLIWTKATDPTTYYLVNYSETPGTFQYGNPNVGGPETTSYTVTGLSGGTTYYFKVRAGNGCMPGDYSNEIPATPTGGFIAGPAAGFIPGVLGTETEDVEQFQGEVKGEEVIATPNPTTEPVKSASTPSGNIFTALGEFVKGIFNFFGRLFGQ